MIFVLNVLEKIFVKAFTITSIVADGDFLINISPFFPFSKANITKSIASCIVIINLVIEESVMVIDFLSKICFTNNGITEPLE